MKYFVASACAVLFVLSLAGGARAETFTGTWTAQRNDGAQRVHLSTEYHRSSATGNEEWSESDDVPLAQLRGVSAADFASRGEHKQFDIVRDAGTLRADGWFANGNASGSWTFVPSASFANTLAQRGVGRPDEKQQFELALTGFKLAMLDTMLRSGFERPSVGDLVSMAQHGVDDAYVTAMKNVPLHPKNAATLVRMRDHGVDPAFAARVLAYNPNLTGDDLVRLRDHGVSGSYIGGLQRLGFRPSAEDLVRLADHGVTIAFIERMRSHGYARLSADDLIRLRDHGF